MMFSGAQKLTTEAAEIGTEGSESIIKNTAPSVQNSELTVVIFWALTPPSYPPHTPYSENEWDTTPQAGR